MQIIQYDETAHAMLAQAESPVLLQLGQNAEKWIRAGYTRTGLCFVLEEAGRARGGLVFGDFEEAELEVMDFAAEGVPQATAADFLNECIRRAKQPAHTGACYNLYNTDGHFEAVRDVFLAAGFRVEQEKQSFAFEGALPPLEGGRLAFAPVAEAGIERFTEVVEQVTRGTLDSLMAADAQRLGGRRAAQEYVDSLLQINPDTSLWQLGSVEGETAGLVIPQQLGEGLGAINYVGVVPEKRGAGYGYELLWRGTEGLLQQGMRRVMADIDCQNTPLAAALLRLGYQFKYDEVVLVKTL